MRSSKKQVRRKSHAYPTVIFSKGTDLTAFGGLPLYQRFVSALGLRARLTRGFSTSRTGAAFGPSVVVMLLVLHLTLGFRRLRTIDFYRHDPLVRRFLGLVELPSVSTIARTMTAVGEDELARFGLEIRRLTLERLQTLALGLITLDFDGVVQGTTGHAEGTAVGFNKRKKGSRSYYPLFCTVAQTSQFLAMLHRPGNVHDSNGAAAFMHECVTAVQRCCPATRIEVRMDSAFFTAPIVDALHDLGVVFTCSVPFERFAELKGLVANLGDTDWDELDPIWCGTELRWKPKSWNRHYRFFAIRHLTPKQQKGPLQLDLFEHRDFHHEYKVVVSNAVAEGVADILWRHNGRGQQERIFGEANQNVGLNVVATRSRNANELFTLSALLAHNLARELHMQTHSARHRHPRAVAARTPLWPFPELRTTRRLLHQPGLLVRPQGEFTLKLAAASGISEDYRRYESALRAAA